MGLISGTPCMLLHGVLDSCASDPMHFLFVTQSVMRALEYLEAQQRSQQRPRRSVFSWPLGLAEEHLVDEEAPETEELAAAAWPVTREDLGFFLGRIDEACGEAAVGREAPEPVSAAEPAGPWQHMMVREQIGALRYDAWRYGSTHSWRGEEGAWLFMPP